MAVGRRCQLPDNKTLRGAPGCRKVQAVERTRVVTCAPAADCTARRRSRRLERPRSPRARLLRAREGDWEACGGDPCTRRPDVTVWSRWKVTTSRGARRLLCRPRVCQTAGVCVQSACLHLTPRCVLSRLADVSVFDYCIWIGCAPSVVAQTLLCRSRGGAHWAAALLRRVRRARRRGRGRVQRTACVRRRHCGVWCEPREVRGRPRCAR